MSRSFQYLMIGGLIVVDVFFSITNKLRKKCRKKLNDDALRFQVEQPKKKKIYEERERENKNEI